MTAHIFTITTAALIVAGLLAGWGGAWLTHRLPELKLGARPKRYWIMPPCGAAIGAGSALWAYIQNTDSLPLLAGFTALLGWQLLVIAVVDAENFWLPDILTIPLGLSGLAASILLPFPYGQGWMASVGSAIIAFGSLWLLAFLYSKLRKRKGLGAGDPILLGMGAAWVGLMDLPVTVLIASVAGLGVVLALKASGRALAMGSKIPYGTYLAIGFAIAWLKP